MLMRAGPRDRYALDDGSGRPLAAEVLRQRYGGDFELLLPGARVHAVAPDGLPPLATAHLASVLAVFTTALSPALVARIELDAGVAASHTLAVAFPLMQGSLQVCARLRVRARGVASREWRVT